MELRTLARLSLTQRLTLFFSVIAALVVIGLGALFLIETEHHFVTLDTMALQEKQQLITAILHRAHSADDARARLGEALSYHEGLYARVRDAQGALVFESTGFTQEARETTPTGASAAAPPATAHAHGAFHALDFQSATAYSSTPVSVTLLADTTQHDRFLADLRRKLAWYVLAALALCGLLSWLAARQGLAPLREMKVRAARVSGQQLGARMPVEAVPVEMADLAQALNRMLARLQDDFQRLIDFSSDLAHELRTPISNLLTQTQVALTAQRDAATYRDILASNAEELERLARMVSDMLFLAKTRRGAELPHKEHFAARIEALALIDFYDAVAAEKQVAVSVQGEGGIEGDRLMFRRALGNLLSNALRHVPAGGEVVIRVAANERTTTVAVDNTGAAIDPHVLPRLFDRFYRADPARAHAGSEGSGLGLAITRAIVEAHGGAIEVKSADEHTCFAMVFPRGSPAP